MSTLPKNFRKLFFRMALVEAFREYFNRSVNKFNTGRGWNCPINVHLLTVGKGWCNYLDVSVKSNYLDFQSKNLDFKSESKSVIDQKTTLVGYSFFDTFVEFVNSIKVYQYRQVNITEERGNTSPYPNRPWRGESWTVQTDGDRLSSVCFRPLLS